MNIKLSTILITGAIITMSATPLWATDEAAKSGSATATKTELGQPTREEEKMMGKTSVPIFASGTTTSDYSTEGKALYALSADKLGGMTVVDRAGETVGTIKSIVLTPDHKSAHAVINAGGFLGMGARDIMVSLSDLRQVEDDVLQMSATSEQIKGLQTYSANPYVALTGDDPIGVSFITFSAFEADGNFPLSSAQKSSGYAAGETASDKETTARSASEKPAVTTQMRSDARPVTAGSGVGDNPLYTHSANSLNGMDVVNTAGETFGTVKHVVLAPTRDSAHAVTSVGGLLGMGARDILLPLDGLTLRDDKLHLRASKEQIDAMKDYKPEEYVEIKGSTPVSSSIVEFSALDTVKDAAGSKAPKAAN